VCCFCSKRIAILRCCWLSSHPKNGCAPAVAAMGGLGQQGEGAAQAFNWCRQSACACPGAAISLWLTLRMCAVLGAVSGQWCHYTCCLVSAQRSPAGQIPEGSTWQLATFDYSLEAVRTVYESVFASRSGGGGRIQEGAFAAGACTSVVVVCHIADFGSALPADLLGCRADRCTLTTHAVVRAMRVTCTARCMYVGRV
jgi:hypothetical protein